jgi:hypothetical protein
MPSNRMLVDPNQTTETILFINENSAKTDTKEPDIARVCRMFFNKWNVPINGTGLCL